MIIETRRIWLEFLPTSYQDAIARSVPLSYQDRELDVIPFLAPGGGGWLLKDDAEYFLRLKHGGHKQLKCRDVSKEEPKKMETSYIYTGPKCVGPNAYKCPRCDQPCGMSTHGLCGSCARLPITHITSFPAAQAPAAQAPAAQAPAAQAPAAIVSCKICNRFCTGIYCDDHNTPAKRGKIRCLEAGCVKWIKKPKSTGPGMFGPMFDPADWFCSNHGKESIDQFPIVDREGDPIWIPAGFQVMKIRDMNDEHLTATLNYLEKSAKTRCKLTGIAQENWESRVTVRFKFLLCEARHRDEDLTCGCDDGLRTYNDHYGWGEHPCEKCIRGQERTKAIEIADSLKKGAEADGIKLKKLFVVTFVCALIAGGEFGYGTSRLIALVLQYLGVA